MVFADETDDAVVERVRAYLEGLTTLKSDFIQVAPSGTVSRGELELRRPKQLRFTYEPPSPLLIVANQGMVFVRDEELETTDSYPLKQTPLRFLLSKQIELEDARVLSVDRGVDSVAVTFASTDEDTQGTLSLILTAPELSLHQWVVRDPQRGATVVSLQDTEYGVKLRNSRFRIPDAGGDFLKD